MKDFVEYVEKIAKEKGIPYPYPPPIISKNCDAFMRPLILFEYETKAGIIYQMLIEAIIDDLFGRKTK